MAGGDVLTLDSVRFAELVAPAISRVFVTGMRAAAAADHDRSLVGPYGGPEVVECVIDLRNPLAAGRSITAAGLRDHHRYTDPADIESTIDRSVVGGLLQRDADGPSRRPAPGSSSSPTSSPITPTCSPSAGTRRSSSGSTRSWPEC